MYYKIFFNILLILLISVFQISFINNLPSFFSQINLFFIVLIFVLSLTNFEYTVWWTVGFGFMLDVFSFNYFGVYLLSYFFTIIFINYLYKNYLTDRSLYSFSILIVVFLVFYELVSKIFFYILYSINNQDIFFLTSKIFWMNIFSSLVINLFAMSILFYVVSLLSEKLKPVFLIKK